MWAALPLLADGHPVSRVAHLVGYAIPSAFLADQRFWRADLPDGQTSHYGVLEPIASNRVNLKKIENQWPDMLRVAGSLVTNQVRAYDLLRMFGRAGHPTPLGQAFAEYGRIDKTMHLLDSLTRWMTPTDAG